MLSYAEHGKFRRTNTRLAMQQTAFVPGFPAARAAVKWTMVVVPHRKWITATGGSAMVRLRLRRDIAEHKSDGQSQ